MALPSFCKDVVTVKRPARVERRGTTVLDWSNPTAITLTRCSFQNQSTMRDMDGRALQVTNGAMLYTSYDADVQAGDRVEYRGGTYEITGEPIPVYGATGRISHYEIPLSESVG